MSSKNISLPLTLQALKNLGSALSECSAALNEQKINAEQKDAACQAQLDNAQYKIDILRQSAQNTVANINELAAKLDKVLN